MAHQSYSPISPETAARLEQPYRPDPLRNVLAKLGREPASLSEALSFESESDRIAEHDAAVAQDAEVNSGEAEWLKRLVDGDGARDPLEQALLEFLAEDGIRPF